MSALRWLLASLAVAGLFLVGAGLFLLAGLAWALIYSGVVIFAGAVLLSREISHA